VSRIDAGETVTRNEVRRRLTALGKRRKKRQAEDEELVEAIKRALAAARVIGGIPMEEAADRLGLNRTTLYQVYLDSPDRREPEPA
jgi:ribosome-binding protein aMBF1 (putative translation factor)